MANQDWAFGLQPTRGPYGGAPEVVRLPLKQMMQATTPYTTAIYKGMLVGWQATVGHLEQYAVTNLKTGIVGVAAEYYAGSASTQTDLAVWMAQDHDFLIQSDAGTTSTDRQDYLFKNFGFTGMTAGNTNTGLSGMELDFSMGTNTGTATDGPCKVIGFQLKPGETVGAANVKCIVRFHYNALLHNRASLTG